MSYSIILSSDTLDIGRQKINSFMQSSAGIWSSDTPNYSVISLQGSNTNQAGGNYSFVTGKNNSASTNSFQILPGGYKNRVVGSFNSILGGTLNNQTNGLGKYNAIINGISNLIAETDTTPVSYVRRGYNTIINGKSNSVDGAMNTVAGDTNTVVGNGNSIFGNSNIIGKNSSYTSMTDKGPQLNGVIGEQNSIIGGEHWYYNEIHGYNNSISASTGDNVQTVTISGTNNRVKGPNVSNVFFHGDYLSNVYSGSPVGKLMMIGTGLNLANPLTPSDSFFGQFIIGSNGTRKVRIMFTTLNNNAYLSSGSWNGSGADYGEFFEWEDLNLNNEDRTGFFVELSEGKIKIAKSKNAIGIVSATPSFVGDSNQDYWKGRVLRDEWGRPLLEYLEKYNFIENGIKKDVYFDESGNCYSELPFTKDKESIKINLSKNQCIFAEKVVTEIMNPNFDPNANYIPREERKEWSVIGLIGKLKVRTSEQITSNAVDIDVVSGMAKNGTTYPILESNKDFDGNYGIVTIFFK